MKTLTLLISSLLLLIAPTAFACHNSTIDNVTSVDNGNGTTTYTIDFTVDVGTLDNYSLGFAFVFASSSGTPVVLSSPAYTASLSRAGYNNLVAYTGATIGSALGANPVNYFDDRYGGRTDVISYESDDDTWGFGSTDYSRQIVVTVQGCVETITLDADFRTVGSATAAGSASCLKTYNTGAVCVSCTVDAITAGTQTSCDPATNTYTQQVIVTYTNAPTTGTLNVNGQTFSITASPQTVTLTGLTADGAAVNVQATFSDSPTCLLDVNSLFTAPAACNSSCTPNNGTWN